MVSTRTQRTLTRYKNDTKLAQMGLTGGSEMIISDEKREEFEAVVDPVIKWLNDNFHPHVHVIIDSTSAKLAEMSVRIVNDKHIKD